MSKIKTIVRVLALASVVVCGSGAGRASAQLAQINLPSSGGYLIIGSVLFDFSGGVYAAFDPQNGQACTWWQIGWNGVLSWDIEVNGTGGNDSMEVYDVPSQTSNPHCGGTFYAFSRGGMTISFFGNAGNDYLKDADYMSGGPGSDELISEGYSLAETGLAYLDGGADRDFLEAETNSGVTLMGGDGNDQLCAVNGVTAIIDGQGGGNYNQCYDPAPSKPKNCTAVSKMTCLGPFPNY